MLQFSDELTTTKPYNLHGHTQYCDGRNTMEEFVNEAITLGFTHYGFSPHSPIPIESSCNILKDRVVEYLNEFKRLREGYGAKLKLYASMEIDYLGDEWGPSHPYFAGLPLDYRIGSVHFVPTQDGTPVDVDGSPERFAQRLEDCFDGDLRYVIDKFYEQTTAMVDKGGFDIVGHFDKIGLNASFVKPGVDREDWYEELVSELIEHIAAAGVTVEINTKHFEKYGRFFPDEHLWGQLLDHNIPIVINSDAHYTELINASRDIATERLEALKAKRGYSC